MTDSEIMLYIPTAIRDVADEKVISLLCNAIRHAYMNGKQGLSGEEEITIDESAISLLCNVICHAYEDGKSASLEETV